MVGVTLSPEQIRSAPPQVRQWIEHEIARSLGLAAAAPQPEHAPPHLVACGREEVQAILEQIQNMLPVVSVFFELGREFGPNVTQGLRSLRLGDIMSHALLHIPAQVVQCLDVINEAMRRFRGDAGATMYAVDQSGHCLIAETTAQNILRLWRDIVAERDLAPGAPEAQSAPAPVAEPAGAYAAGLPEKIAFGVPSAAGAR
jgi:hypothetical protein